MANSFALANLTKSIIDRELFEDRPESRKGELGEFICPSLNKPEVHPIVTNGVHQDSNNPTNRVLTDNWL